jgi:hypothetical protein
VVVRHPKVWGLLAALASLPLVEGSGRAAGQLFVTFEYQIDASVRGCPGESEILEVIGRQLGYDPFRAEADDHVTFQVESGERGPEGRVVWTDRNMQWKGERRFSPHGADCDKLSQDMVFAVAVQIQLLATERERAAASSPMPPQPVPPAKPEATIPARTRWSYAAGAGASGAWGLAPAASAQGRVFLGAQRGRASVELEGEATLPSTTYQADGSGFTSYSWIASTAGCFHVSRFSTCAVGKAGQIRVRGLGVDAPRSTSGLLVQAGPRFALRQSLGERFFVLARADVLVTLTRRTVTLNRTEVWTTPRFAEAAGIDFGMRFR